MGGCMRRYDETVDVRVQHAGPVAFLWRDRLYVVREVLGCWFERQAWWSGGGGVRADAIGEQRIWRVEAGSGRTTGPASGTGVFELCEPVPLGAGAVVESAPGAHRWRLLRSLD